MTTAKAIKVKIARLANGRDLALPAYQSKDAAGLDLVAAIPEDAPIVLGPGARIMVPTGFAVELPRGTEAQVRPRSGLAAKHGVTVLNSPGTIDADYRGEVCVILINHGDAPFTIRRGDRIAQMVIATVVQARIAQAKALSATKRGAGGFGSTGTSVPSTQPLAAKKKNLIASKALKAKSTTRIRTKSKVR
jgi:dUTP pyrophosphatase